MLEDLHRHLLGVLSVAYPKERFRGQFLDFQLLGELLEGHGFWRLVLLLGKCALRGTDLPLQLSHGGDLPPPCLESDDRGLDLHELSEGLRDLPAFGTRQPVILAL